MKYTFKQHLILEKSVRLTSMPGNYLLNPTGPELIRFFQKVKGQSIRFLSTEKNLYVFGAYEHIHDSFIKRELLMFGGWREIEGKEGEPLISGAIDPLNHSEGTYFDPLLDFVKIPSRKWQYKPVLQLYQWILKEYEDDEVFASNDEIEVGSEELSHTWWWENTFKKRL